MKKLLLALVAAALPLTVLAFREVVHGGQPGTPDAPPPTRPNILVILTDDQRAGGTMTVMPKTVRLMGDGGTRYPNGVVTTPLCCPSRASIFSGRYVHNHGVGVGPTRVTLQEYDMDATIQAELSAAGYKTAIAGKFLNGWQEDPPHFDKWVLFRALYTGEAGYGTSRFNLNGTDRTVDTYSTVYLQRKSADFLDYFERTDDVPWFMQVSPYAPHAPAIPEDKYAEAAVPSWPGNPAQQEDDVSDKFGWVSKAAGSKEDARSFRKKQLRTLMSVDDLVARTFAKLDALDETEDTLVFFLSDNGWLWYEHRLNGKRFPYDQAVRVPFYVRWPGHVDGGAVDDRIVANIDIAPTVYEAASITPDYPVDGRSIFTSDRSEILMEYLHYPAYGSVPNWRALWTPTSTYIRYESEGKSREAYVPGDPWQLANVYKDGIRHNSPSDQAERESALERYADCVGTACP